ncbi:hypothetical protein AB0D57_44600 [Streptomyces sp. NPDC048275]|uniref:hypothetical protein n=1 Tax=Streptomyces sp. NPDC048275 TaxID=3155629 RepID=UPI0033DAB312
MAQTKFNRKVDETAEALMFGIGRFLGGRDMDGMKRTDATFLRSATRVRPKVEGRVSRSSYRAGWQRLTFRMTFLSAADSGGFWTWENQETARDLIEHRDATLQALQTGGIGAASAAAGGLAYGLLNREHRELMRQWVVPLHEALTRPLVEQTAPRHYLHVPKNFSDDDAEIRVGLPVHLRFSRDEVADLITQNSPWRA